MNGKQNAGNQDSYMIPKSLVNCVVGLLLTQFFGAVTWAWRQDGLVSKTAAKTESIEQMLNIRFEGMQRDIDRLEDVYKNLRLDLINSLDPDVRVLVNKPNLTTDELARIERVTTETVQRWCREGVIAATKIEGGWSIQNPYHLEPLQ